MRENIKRMRQFKKKPKNNICTGLEVYVCVKKQYNMIENTKKESWQYMNNKGVKTNDGGLWRRGLRSNVHVAETARQIYKMHKNPTKQTLCVDLRCMKTGRFLDFWQWIDLNLCERSQIMWKKKTNNRTSFCWGKKNSQSSSWPMFQSSLSLKNGSS